MKRNLMGQMVRDSRSGLVGKVIGVVTWEQDHMPSSLVVQPQVLTDQTIPPSVYVPESMAEIVPQADKPPVIQ